MQYLEFDGAGVEEAPQELVASHCETAALLPPLYDSALPLRSPFVEGDGEAPAGALAEKNECGALVTTDDQNDDG